MNRFHFVGAILTCDKSIEPGQHDNDYYKESVALRIRRLFMATICRIITSSELRASHIEIETNSVKTFYPQL